jgi:hypothetical protein
LLVVDRDPKTFLPTIPVVILLAIIYSSIFM